MGHSTSNQQEISGHLSDFDKTWCVCSTYGAHHPYQYLVVNTTYGTAQVQGNVRTRLPRTQKWGSQTRFRDASETRATRVSNAGETRLRRGQYAFKTRANVTLDLSCTVVSDLWQYFEQFGLFYFTNVQKLIIVLSFWNRFLAN